MGPWYMIEYDAYFRLSALLDVAVNHCLHRHQVSCYVWRHKGYGINSDSVECTGYLLICVKQIWYHHDVTIIFTHEFRQCERTESSIRRTMRVVQLYLFCCGCNTIYCWIYDTISPIFFRALGPCECPPRRPYLPRPRCAQLDTKVKWFCAL